MHYIFVTEISKLSKKTWHCGWYVT